MTDDAMLSMIQDALDQVGALTAMVEELQSKATQQDGVDTSTAGGGFEVDNVPEEIIKPVLSLSSYVKDGSGNITAVKIWGITAHVIENHCVLANDGTITRTAGEQGIGVVGGSITVDTYEWTVPLADGANLIFVKTDASTIPLGNSNLVVGSADYPFSGAYLYTKIARIVVSSGKVTAMDWFHVGDIQLFSWELGTYITEATLNGNLTDGYTLETKSRTLTIGPLCAGGAIS